MCELCEHIRQINVAVMEKYTEQNHLPPDQRKNNNLAQFLYDSFHEQLEEIDGDRAKELLSKLMCELAMEGISQARGDGILVSVMGVDDIVNILKMPMPDIRHDDSDEKAGPM